MPSRRCRSAMQFLTASMSVDATAGSALVHVERAGNLNAIVSVNYATSNGTAVAGKDYTAASGTLTFQAGETDKTFSVTILPNPSQAASSVTVNLALSQPTGGSTLGSPSTAILTINNNLPPILQFSSSTYTTYYRFQLVDSDGHARGWKPRHDGAGQLRHGGRLGRCGRRLHSGLGNAHLPGQPDHGDVHRADSSRRRCDGHQDRRPGAVRCPPEAHRLDP